MSKEPLFEGRERLTPEVREQLINHTISDSSLLGMVRKIKMVRSIVEMGHLTVGAQRHLATRAERVEMRSSRITLPWAVTEEFLQDNPERAKELLLRMMGAQISHDLEDLALHGDTESGDQLLLAQDGWRKRSTEVRVVTFRRRAIREKDILRALSALPPHGLKGVHIFASPANRWLDMMFRNPGNHGPEAHVLGVPVSPSPYLTATQILVTNPENLILGIEEGIILRETTEGKNAIDFDERYFSLHIRVAFQVQDPSASINLYLIPWYTLLPGYSRVVKMKHRVKRALRRITSPFHLMVQKVQSIVRKDKV